MISVWDAQTRLSLAALASPDGDEVKATLKALKSLDLKGGIATSDALHCHPKMAEAIRAQGGHYALKLKKNNGPLPLAARYGLRRGRLPNAQEPRAAKSLHYPPDGARHPEGASGSTIARAQNETRRMEERILLRTLYSYAIALGASSGSSRPRPTARL
jgi:hypothetical protein